MSSQQAQLTDDWTGGTDDTGLPEGAHTDIAQTRDLGDDGDSATPSGERLFQDHANGQCIACGSQVSTAYVRVFGAGGVVDGCLHCESNREVHNGNAVPDGRTTQ